MQPWNVKVQERCAQIYHEENQDVFILKFHAEDNMYAAIPRMDPLMLSVMMAKATIVYYCSQRLKEIDMGP